jgi:hypothetical protein
VTVLGAVLGAACVVVAAVHLLGLAGGDRFDAPPHGAMALGTAAMLVPALDPVPGPAWVVVFTALGLGAVAVRRPVPHAIGCAAMLVMLLAGHGHGGERRGGSLLASAVTLVLLAWCLLELARLPAGRRLAVARGVPTAAMAVVLLGAL